MTAESQSPTRQCIRCDDPAGVKYPDNGDYVLLTYGQETGAVPVCMDCFEEVKRRDLWSR